MYNQHHEMIFNYIGVNMRKKSSPPPSFLKMNEGHDLVMVEERVFPR